MRIQHLLESARPRYAQATDRDLRLHEDAAPERKEGNILKPGNTVGFNVFELPPDERSALNGTTVYHQTRKLAQILKSGALKPRADASGMASFAINTVRAGRDFQAPKGIFVSRGPNGWYGDDIAFKILPSDKIYRAYGATGHLLITNPVPVERFIDLGSDINEQVLLEYDRDRAVQALGKNLLLALIRDTLGLWRVPLDQLQNHLSLRKIDVSRYFDDPAYQKPYIDGAMNQIEAADPSTNKKYTQWMARQLANGSEPKLEDITSTLADAVNKFNRLNLKRKLPAGENDINRYKTAKQLYDTMDRYDDPVDDNDQGKADKPYEDSEVKVVIPRDQAAACAYGRQTRWCTAATKGQNYFEQYNSDGPLYILIPKNPDTPGEKYQLHFETGSYMDKDDDPVDIGDLLTDRFPELGKWFLANPATASQLADEVSFASDELLQKISDDIWGYVEPVIMDDYSNWESNDDSYHEWLRDEGYVTDDGDVDWDRAPGYEDYNPDAWRWVRDTEEFVHLDPRQLRRAATEAWQNSEFDDRSVYNLETAIAWNVKDKMRRDEPDGEGVANWINRNLRIISSSDGPRVELIKKSR